MRYSILLFCLLSGFLSQGDSRAACALVADQICSAADLDLPEVNEITKDDLHYLPFFPRKLKSKAREVLEIPNVFIAWYFHCFSSPAFLFVQNSELIDDFGNLFLRGPPRD